MASNTRPTRGKIDWTTLASRLDDHEVADLDRLVAEHGTTRSVYIREVLLRHFRRALGGRAA